MRILCTAVLAALLAFPALGQDAEVSLDGSCATLLSEGTYHVTPECLEKLKKEKKNLFTYFRQAPHVTADGKNEFKLTKRNFKPKK